MKKTAFFALALIASLFIGSTSVAMAAPSPTAEDTQTLSNAASSTQGTITSLDLDKLTEANNFARDLVAKIISSAQTKSESTVDANGNLILVNDNVPLGTSAEPELLAAFDFVPSEEVLSQIANKGKAVVSFKVANVKKGDSVKILHFENGTWVVIEPTEVKDGEVSGEFTNFSPIVITKLTADVAGLEKTSGGVNMFVIAGITGLALVAVVAVFVLGRKKDPAKKN